MPLYWEVLLSRKCLPRIKHLLQQVLSEQCSCQLDFLDLVGGFVLVNDVLSAKRGTPTLVHLLRHWLVSLTLSGPLKVLLYAFLDGQCTRLVLLCFFAIAEHEACGVLVFLLALHREGCSGLRKWKFVVGLIEGENLQTATFVLLGVIGEGRKWAPDWFGHGYVGDIAQRNIVFLMIAVVVVFLLLLVAMWRRRWARTGWWWRLLFHRPLSRTCSLLAPGRQIVIFFLLCYIVIVLCLQHLRSEFSPELLHLVSFLFQCLHQFLLDAMGLLDYLLHLLPPVWRFVEQFHVVFAIEFDEIGKMWL